MILKNLEKDKLNNKVIELIDTLKATSKLDKEQYFYIIENIDKNAFEYLKQASREVTDKTYGKNIYLRGLIEISNHCTQNCNYCGIRMDNANVDRYRLTHEDILECCRVGYELGYRTFVMQGGEDPYYSKDRLSAIIKDIKENYPDVAVTLSIGERSYEDYKAFYDAGADRFLLRHESASKKLYEKLHPDTMSYDNRIRCIRDLKAIGYQAGIGFMVGSPFQTDEDLANDLMFVQEFQPAMCGIGPYINHSETPFKNEASGQVNQTLVMVALVRLIIPNSLLPATTALATLDNEGRLEALKFGANVVMPNLSPNDVRKNYEIYQGKVFTKQESASYKKAIIAEIENAGLKVELVRGDTKMEGY